MAFSGRDAYFRNKTATPEHEIVNNSFFLDITWWLLLGAAFAAAAIPSFIRPFRPLTVFFSAISWCVAVAFVWARYNTAAALAASMLSLAGGIIVFLLAVFFSGLDLMAKKRYR